MNDKNIDFEMLITLACEQILDENIDRINNVEVDDITPAQIPKKIKRAINVACFKDSKAYAVIKRLSISCAVLLVLFAGTVIFVPPVRAYVWEIVTNWFDESFDIQFDSKDRSNPKYIEEYILPILPEGWIVTQQEDAKQFSLITSPDGKLILFTQTTVEAGIWIDDGDGYKAEEIILKNSAKAYLHTNTNGFSSLMWEDEYVFILEGVNIPTEMLIYIANNVK